jgi:hypothetical protein
MNLLCFFLPVWNLKIQDGIMRSMEDEMHSLIADSPDTMSRSP